MSSFKEIVTKAVVGKGRKKFSNTYNLELDNPSTIFGCWVINHNFKGVKEKDSVKVDGSFDVNIWYSKEDNTKTLVAEETIEYSEIIPITTLDDYDGQDEIIVRMIKQPTCVDATVEDGKVIYKIEMTIATELVGDTKIKIGVEDSNELLDSVDDEIDDEVKEDFLN